MTVPGSKFPKGKETILSACLQERILLEMPCRTCVERSTKKSFQDVSSMEIRGEIVRK